AASTNPPTAVSIGAGFRRDSRRIFRKSKWQSRQAGRAGCTRRPPRPPRVNTVRPPDSVCTDQMTAADGGSHWTSLRGSPGGDDYQNLWVSPDDPRHIALVGDQGAIISVNGGATWSSWLNQPTAQLYHIGV